MVRYILRTVYTSVFQHDDSPGVSCNQSVSGSDRFIAFKHKIRHYARLASYGCILYNVFGEGSNSVIVSGWLANLIMISEEH